MNTQTSLSPADTELAYRRLLDAHRGPLGTTALSVLEQILLSEDPVTVAELRQKLPLSRTHLGTTLVRLADRQLILHVTRGVYVRNPEALLHVMPESPKALRRLTTRDGTALEILELLVRSSRPVHRDELLSELLAPKGIVKLALQYLLEHQLIHETQRAHYQMQYWKPQTFTLESEEPKEFQPSL